MLPIRFPTTTAATTGQQETQQYRAVPIGLMCIDVQLTLVGVVRGWYYTAVYCPYCIVIGIGLVGYV